MSTCPPTARESPIRLLLLRFCARHLDYALWGLCVAFLLQVSELRISSAQAPTEALILAVVAWPVLTGTWALLEAPLLATAGTTPGKWLLGLAARPSQDGGISLRAAFARSLRVWAFGSAFAAHPVALLAYAWSYTRARHRETSWDPYAHIVYVGVRPIAVLAVLGCVSVQVWSMGVMARTYAHSRAEKTLRAEVYALAKDKINLFAASGLELTPVGPMRRVPAGYDKHESTLDLAFGGSVLVIGACSGCNDLDLAVDNPVGFEVDADRAAGADPVLEFEPGMDGAYRVTARVYGCGAEHCAAGYQVLRSPGVLAVRANGTGFVIDGQGTILTAHHVIYDAESISITFSDGSVSEATVLATSEINDLALLRSVTPPSEPAFLPLAAPGSARLGEPILVVGFPMMDLLGPGTKVSDGSVTSLSGRYGDSSQLQISAAIQPGSSGSPLLSFGGQVLGVVTSSAVDRAVERDMGRIPQLINWATKSEIAWALLHASPGRGDLPRESWVATSRRQAIERAAESVVVIRVGPADRSSRSR